MEHRCLRFENRMDRKHHPVGNSLVMMWKMIGRDSGSVDDHWIEWLRGSLVGMSCWCGWLGWFLWDFEIVKCSVGMWVACLWIHNCASSCNFFKDARQKSNKIFLVFVAIKSHWLATPSPSLIQLELYHRAAKQTFTTVRIVAPKTSFDSLQGQWPCIEKGRRMVCKVNGSDSVILL